MRNVKFVIDEKYDGMKVKTFLKYEKSFSSRLITSLKKYDNGILLNGIHCRTVDELKNGDILEINMADGENEIEPVYYPFDIIYEDDDILVINKPSGIAMHPTHNHQGDTLANGVAYYFQGKGKNVPFRAVGRLDKETSGLVLCALNKYSASFLPDNYKKEYLAVAGGVFSGNGTIDKKICRPDERKSYRWVGEDGDTAVTHWSAIATDGERTLLRINLETGRTHQIRVHFASENAPLAGDDMYNSKDCSIGRVALHCEKMTLIHPVTREVMEFVAPIPDDMRNIIDKMKEY